MMRRGARLVVLALAASTTLTACGDDDGCAGERDGDVTLRAGLDSPMPDGGNVGIGSVNTDADPPRITFVLGDATETERDGAIELEAGDTFTLKNKTYTVAGFCEDKAWLDEGA